VSGLASHYNYDAYGETQTNTSSVLGTNTKLYCGEQWDSTLNMYNLRARYYDPSNGRFNQRDAFDGRNEDPQSLHRYLYCRGDPSNSTDPSGCDVIQALVTIGIILTLASALWHTGSALRSAANGHYQKAAADMVWAMVDLLFLFAGGGLGGVGGASTVESADVLSTGTSLARAGVPPAAVWGYISMTAGVTRGAAGGGGGGGGGGSGGDGPGEWVPEDQSNWSPEAQAYQWQVTGQSGKCYRAGGVRFDGWNQVRRVFLEAKDYYSWALNGDGSWKFWFDPEEEFVDKALRQFNAAKGLPIEWHFAEKSVADAVRPLVGGKVTVIYEPPTTIIQ